MEWQDIETVDTAVNFNEIVLAHFWQPRDEDGDPTGPLQCSWAHVAYPTSASWQCATGGFKDMHGFASFPLALATHWARLPKPPVSDQ